MRLLDHLLLFLAAGVMLVSCEDLFGGAGEISVDPSDKSALVQTLGSTAMNASGLTFTTKGPWSSYINDYSAKSGSPASWISISPDHGEDAGEYTIEINLEENNTGADRKAVIVIVCGDDEVSVIITQKSTPDVPAQDGDNQDQNGESSAPSYVKYVKTISYEYTHYTGDKDEEKLTFSYDDRKRIVRVILDEKNTINDGSSSETTTSTLEYRFNYGIVGEVAMTIPGEEGSGMIATIDDKGRVTSVRSEDAMSDSGVRFAYNEQGYLSGYYAIDGAATDRINLYYTDGLFSAVGEFDYDGKEDVEHMPYFSSMYAHRYANDKINVDLNPFIMDSELDGLGDNIMCWIVLRMCGKFSDCLMENADGFADDLIEENFMGMFDIPNQVIPVEYKEVRYVEPDGGSSLTWTFDEQGCPLTVTGTAEYQEYIVKYNILVGDEVIDQRPTGEVDENGNEILRNYYYYTTSEKVRTKTENKWNCQESYVITYTE